MTLWSLSPDPYFVSRDYSLLSWEEQKGEGRLSPPLPEITLASSPLKGED